MCNPGTSAYFLLKGCPQVTLCFQVWLSLQWKIVEADFPEQWVSSLPLPATGTPHKSLLRGIYGPYFCKGRNWVWDEQTFIFYVILSQLALMRIVFQSAKCCLEGPGRSQNGVKEDKVLRLMFQLIWILTCTAQEKTPQTAVLGWCVTIGAFSTAELIPLAAQPFFCRPSPPHFSIL